MAELNLTLISCDDSVYHGGNLSNVIIVMTIYMTMSLIVNDCRWSMVVIDYMPQNSVSKWGDMHRFMQKL